MDDRVLVVLTGKSRERLMSEGGTSDWVLNPSVVRGFEYVICVRHGNPPYDPGAGPRPEPHGAAFLVAKIADLQKTSADGERDRYLVLFEAVADVLIPDFWDGSRNPVRYMPLSEASARGIDFKALNFRTFTLSHDAKTRPAERGPANAVKPLTIAEAKRGLAAAFDLPIEAIEITIKG